MKNLLLTLSFCLITFLSFSQDAVTIKHTNYTTVYSKSKCYPIMVEWWVTKAKVSCDKPLARKDNFQPDPELPKETNLKKDYVGSGFDRGHMMPAADNLCQTPKVQDECFYFSKNRVSMMRKQKSQGTRDSCELNFDYYSRNCLMSWKSDQNCKVMQAITRNVSGCQRKKRTNDNLP